MKRDRWLIFSLCLVALGITAFVVASLVLTSEHAAKENKITAEATRNAAAAQVALAQAHHDRAFLYAICRALNRRDAISEWTTRALAQAEAQYHPEDAQSGDFVYHAARERILAKAMKARNAVASFDCIKGMVKAVTEAPTDPPTLEASATP